MSLNYDALTATTRKHYLKPLVDNVFNATPLLSYLRRKQKPAPGGTKLVQPLIYAANTSRGSYQGYDVLTVAPTEEITAAEYDWKQLYVTLTISGAEEAKNRGTAAVLNLLESKMEIAKQSLIEMFSKQLWGDGTGNGGKDITGIQAAIDDGTNVAVYGGINRATHTWWKSQYGAGTGGNRPLSLSLVNSMITATTRGADRPDLIVTTPELWDALWEILQKQQRYEATRVADTGFDEIRFRGRSVVYDDDCPEGSMWFINSDYLTLRPHVEYANFKDTGWKKPVNQDAAVMQLLWMGNLTSSNCRRQGVLWDLEPPSENGNGG